MNIKNTFFTGLTVLVLASGAAKAEQYTYQDNFSTDKVLTDSYQHSPIFSDYPLIQVSPFIVHSDNFLDKRLEFFSGFTMYGDAALLYNFPLNGRVEGIDSGSLSFDAGWNYLHNSGPGHLRVSSSDNGQTWNTLYEQDGILVPPPIIPISLNLPHSSAANQYVMIQGMNIIVDNLSLTIGSNEITPTEVTSWGDVKTLFK